MLTFIETTLFTSRQGEIWMLTLYAKNEVESIPGHVLKKIKEEIDGGA